MTGRLETPFPEAWAASKAVLAVASLPLSTAEAAELMLRYYATAGKATRLTGERDDNFRIDGRDGARLVLKVAHHQEDRLVTNLHTSLLLYLAVTTPAIPTPRVLATKDGLSEHQLTSGHNAGRVARVTSYLYGRPLHSVSPSASLRREVGATLARLDQCLRHFTHGAADRILIWDLQWADHLKELIPVIPDRNARQTLLRHVDSFATVVSPQLTTLRSQMIHNDFNSGNILIDPYRRVVSGILDFGDAVRAPLILDVAVAASYHITGDVDPTAAAIDLVVGYHQIETLLREELTIFFDLVLMRLIFRIVITEWRASLFPADRPYIVRNLVTTWAQFNSLQAVSHRVVVADLMRRCGVI